MFRKSKDTFDFDAIFKEYNAYVFKIVINESNNQLTKEDIEEIVSDTFFQLWKNYRKIKNQNKIKSYVGKIAKNTTCNRLRIVKKDLSFDEKLIIKSNNIDSFNLNEQVDLIHQALQKMDDIDKKLFVMYYYENKKIKEIARLENMNVANIKTKLYRTRKNLKKLLERSGFKR